MAVTGRTSSFSESRFFELLTAATTPASQAKLRRSISGEKYQRVLTSGSGASLLPCDATLPRRNTPPRNNNTSAYRFNSATATGVPPIEDILQSLRRLNADVQICHASSKRKENRPSSPILHHHPLRSPSPREPAPIITDPVNLRRSHHHCNESEALLVSSTAALDPSLKRMEVGVERLGELVQFTKNQVETILSQVRELSGEFLESSSPKLHQHREDVLHHQEISEVSLLASSVLQQSEIKSREIIDPVNRIDSLSHTKHGISEMSISSTVVDEIPVLEIQEFKEVVAHQVFEEMPQPTTQTFDDDSEVTKNQKPEATQANNPSKGLEIYHVQKASEVEIDFLKNEVKLELSLSVKEVQDDTIVFSAMSTEELSYEVKVNCKWGTVQIIDFVIAQFLQVLRQNGAVEERMGVG